MAGKDVSVKAHMRSKPHRKGGGGAKAKKKKKGKKKQKRGGAAASGLRRSGRLRK